GPVPGRAGTVGAPGRLADDADRPQPARERRRGVPRGAHPALRARRAALPRPAVRRGDADDPQPAGRRGPGAGDVREGLRRVPPVQRGHQPQGVAVPHPHQHVHQHLPQEAARAAAVHVGGRRGLAARPCGVAHLLRPEVCGDGGARAPARQRREGGAVAAAGGVPARGVPRRRRGLPLQGDRADHGHADRHGDVPAAPWPQAAARAAHRLRPRPWDAGGGVVM
ncbi:MAG: RNA polymerase ECF-type sigma factor, partial [uncultured Nocardioidaceae bacterium]